jgi:hypothetical protein
VGAIRGRDDHAGAKTVDVKYLTYMVCIANYVVYYVVATEATGARFHV